MDAQKIEPEEVVPASRKLGRSDALALAKSAKRVIVAKGAKVQDFAIAGKPDPAAIDAMLGPTGNLRAPCLRVGTTLIVGFSDAAYREVLGGAMKG